jgi:chemotaxis protein CheD
VTARAAIGARRRAAPADPGRRGHFDPAFGAHSVRVLPGHSYTTGARDEMIVTVLGSCVAACVRDPATGFGGMNHFMLPESETGDWNGVGAALRYGNHAMEALINAVLKSGCRRENLEVKLFGGADLNAGSALVGTKNAQFALRYCDLERLTVAAADLGGPVGRRIHYFPATGRVKRLLLPPTNVRSILAEERRYGTSLTTVPVEGDIELFD